MLTSKSASSRGLTSIATEHRCPSAERPAVHEKKETARNHRAQPYVVTLGQGQRTYWYAYKRYYTINSINKVDVPFVVCVWFASESNRWEDIYFSHIHTWYLGTEVQSTTYVVPGIELHQVQLSKRALRNLLLEQQPKLLQTTIVDRRREQARKALNKPLEARFAVAALAYT